MIAQDEYKVQLEVFEGPLDLLLYLIKKDEVDIYDIPIERIAAQYVRYLDLMRMLDLDIAGEFLVMAATLMVIKSRMLLPEDERPAEEQEEEEDPRWDLVRQLVEYKKFKDAALFLETREETQGNVFTGSAQEAPALEAGEGLALKEVSIFDLISAFNDALKRIDKEDLGTIFAERFTVADKIELILKVVAAGGAVPFSRLFEAAATRHEVVCTFLALLELIRLRQIRASQPERFGEIVVGPCPA